MNLFVGLSLAGQGFCGKFEHSNKKKCKEHTSVQTNPAVYVQSHLQPPEVTL